MKNRMLVICLLVILSANLACRTGLDLIAPSTPTPTATATFPPTLTPTATLTPTLTPTPTMTPTPVPESVYQMDEFEDGTTLFTDHELGYQMVFGSEWMVIPMDPESQADFIDSVQGELSGDLAAILEESAEQIGIRLIAADLAHADVAEDSMPSISVIFQEESGISWIGIDAIIMMQVELLPSMIPGATVLSDEIIVNPQGVEYGKIVVNYTDETFGETMKQVIVMILLDEGLFGITFSANADVFADVEYTFQDVLDSFERIPLSN